MSVVVWVVAGIVVANFAAMALMIRQWWRERRDDRDAVTARQIGGWR